MTGTEADLVSDRLFGFVFGVGVAVLMGWLTLFMEFRLWKTDQQEPARLGISLNPDHTIVAEGLGHLGEKVIRVEDSVHGESVTCYVLIGPGDRTGIDCLSVQTRQE